MSEKTVTTPSPDEMIAWIDEQVHLEQYATSYDSLGKEALDMLAAMKNFINRRRNDKPDGSI